MKLPIEELVASLVIMLFGLIASQVAKNWRNAGVKPFSLDGGASPVPSPLVETDIIRVLSRMVDSLEKMREDLAETNDALSIAQHERNQVRLSQAEIKHQLDDCLHDLAQRVAREVIHQQSDRDEGLSPAPD